MNIILGDPRDHSRWAVCDFFLFLFIYLMLYVILGIDPGGLAGAHRRLIINYPLSSTKF